MIEELKERTLMGLGCGAGCLVSVVMFGVVGSGAMMLASMGGSNITHDDAPDLAIAMGLICGIGAGIELPILMKLRDRKKIKFLESTIQSADAMLKQFEEKPTKDRIKILSFSIRSLWEKKEEVDKMLSKIEKRIGMK